MRRGILNKPPNYFSPTKRAHVQTQFNVLRTKVLSLIVKAVPSLLCEEIFSLSEEVSMIV